MGRDGIVWLKKIYVTLTGRLKINMFKIIMIGMVYGTVRDDYKKIINILYIFTGNYGTVKDGTVRL